MENNNLRILLERAVKLGQHQAQILDEIVEMFKCFGLNEHTTQSELLRIISESVKDSKRLNFLEEPKNLESVFNILSNNNKLNKDQLTDVSIRKSIDGFMNKL